CFLVVSIVLQLLISCSPGYNAPEEEIRALLRAAEVAAEDMDIKTLKGFVSDRYTDSNGHDKRAINGLFMYYFLRHQSIHLLTRIQGVEFPEPTLAEVTVFVAMAGRPILGTEELAILHADLYRFDLRLRDENKDGWKFINAEWRRAELDDFI
ncbi:MAG: hypothetical protein V3U20_05150, partial [Thermoplasmata archaeon]